MRRCWDDAHVARGGAPRVFAYAPVSGKARLCIQVVPMRMEDSGRLRPTQMLCKS